MWKVYPWASQWVCQKAAGWELRLVAEMVTLLETLLAGLLADRLGWKTVQLKAI